MTFIRKRASFSYVKKIGVGMECVCGTLSERLTAVKIMCGSHVTHLVCIYMESDTTTRVIMRFKRNEYVS